jgi:hypothetical protein
MRVVTEWLSPRQMAKIASEVTGKTVLPMEPSEEEFKNSKTTGEEMYLNLLFFVKVVSLRLWLM